MKIKTGFIKRTVGGRNIAVAVGERCKDFDGMITLNDMAGFIWDCLESDTTTDEIITKVLKEYDVDRQKATDDATSFIKTLKDAGLIDE
jgi:hypothetical protein